MTTQRTTAATCSTASVTTNGQKLAMKRTSRLRTYLDYFGSGDPGWRAAWDHDIAGEQSTAWMLGYCQGILDELITIIGHDRAVRLVGAYDDLKDHIATMSAEVDK